MQWIISQIHARDYAKEISKDAEKYALSKMWSGFALLKIVSIEDVISRVEEIAEDKLAKGMSADEFIEIGGADGFKIYVTAGKTIDDSPHPLHGNPRDVFMLVLDGEIEFIFENGGKATVKSGECYVFAKAFKA